MAERLVFDPSLYLSEAVEAAAEAYSEHAQIAVTASDGSIAAEIEVADGSDHDEKMIAHAFSNHVLFETVARKQQAALDEGA